MQEIVIILSFSAGFFLFLAFFSRLLGSRILMTKRLTEMKTRRQLVDQRDEELEKPFFERILYPALLWISRTAAKLSPFKKNTNLERKLVRAGQPLGLKSDEFIAVYYVTMVIFFLGGIGLAFFQGLANSSIIMYAAIGILLGYGLVEIWLRSKARTRSEEISRSLPDMLDLLTVSVEAGLGFDSALTRVVEKSKGSIAEEISDTLQEMKMGKPRRDALRDLAQRSDVEELKTFVSSVIQADQLGVSIGNVLRSQSEQTRMRRRQKVEAKAMKAPIIMLIPMMLFIFPTIFIVVLAPGIIQMMEGFK